LKLRPYQEEAHKFLSQWQKESNKETILSLPCGAGKTYTASSWTVNLIKDGIRIFWAVHREELKKQAIKAFTQLGFIPTVWDASNKPKKWSQINIIMIPSSYGIVKIKDKQKSLLVVDEGHHKNAPTWENLINVLSPFKVLYLTATPSEIAHEFDSIFKKTYEELSDDGYLAKAVYERVLTKIEYAMHANRSDFTYKSLNQLDTKQRNDIVVKRWLDHKDRYGKSLAFVATVNHAESLYKAFKKKHDKVFLITGKTKDRDKILEEYANLPTNEPSILISVDIFVEGIDIPSVTSILICRPTLSAVLYVQMIGRASRLAPNKTNCYIIDFVDAVKRYELRSAAMASEVLGDKVIGKEIKDEVDRSDKKAFLKKKFKKDPKILGISPEQIDDLVGICVWKNRFRKTLRTIPIFSGDVERLFAIYTRLNTAIYKKEDIKNIIYLSWAEIGIESTLSFKLWKEMCWSISGMFSGYDTSAKFKIDFISHIYKPNKNKLRSYDKIAQDTNEFLAELNNEFRDKESEIWKAILQHLYKVTYDKSFVSVIDENISIISYYNRILSLKADKRCSYLAKKPTKTTPCLANLSIWKRQINNALKEIVDDNKAEVAFTFSN
jgi:superfamily II DNA or RNA helicase